MDKYIKRGLVDVKCIDPPMDGICVSHAVILNDNEFLLGFGNMSYGICKYNICCNKFTPFIKYENKQAPLHHDHDDDDDESKKSIFPSDFADSPESSYNIQSMTINHILNELYVYVSEVDFVTGKIESFLIKINLDNINLFKIIKIDKDSAISPHIIINNTDHMIDMQDHSVLLFDEKFDNYRKETLFTFQQKGQGTFNYHFQGTGLIYLKKNDILIQYGGVYYDPVPSIMLDEIWISFNVSQSIKNEKIHYNYNCNDARNKNDESNINDESEDNHDDDNKGSEGIKWHLLPLTAVNRLPFKLGHAKWFVTNDEKYVIIIGGLKNSGLSREDGLVFEDNNDIIVWNLENMRFCKYCNSDDEHPSGHDNKNNNNNNNNDNDDQTDSKLKDELIIGMLDTAIISPKNENIDKIIMGFCRKCCNNNNCKNKSIDVPTDLIRVIHSYYDLSEWLYLFSENKVKAIKVSDILQSLSFIDHDTVHVHVNGAHDISTANKNTIAKNNKYSTLCENCKQFVVPLEDEHQQQEDLEEDLDAENKRAANTLRETQMKFNCLNTILSELKMNGRIIVCFNCHKNACITFTHLFDLPIYSPQQKELLLNRVKILTLENINKNSNNINVDDILKSFRMGLINVIFVTDDFINDYIENNKNKNKNNCDLCKQSAIINFDLKFQDNCGNINGSCDTYFNRIKFANIFDKRHIIVNFLIPKTKCEVSLIKEIENLCDMSNQMECLPNWYMNLFDHFTTFGDNDNNNNQEEDVDDDDYDDLRWNIPSYEPLTHQYMRKALEKYDKNDIIKLIMDSCKMSQECENVFQNTLRA